MGDNVMDILERARAWDAYELSGPVPEPMHMYEVVNEIEDLRAAKAELVDALNVLQANESVYREVHDLKGAGDMATGRAWDCMRHAGDKARALVAKHGETE